MSHVPARVIVLAGPSGAGKSRLAERLGLPVLRLDDFYKDGDDPSLPTITDRRQRRAGRLGPSRLVAARRCARGPDGVVPGRSTEVPVYEIALNGRCGSQPLDLAGSPLFVAEGIFAPEIVPDCRRAGLLEAAYCITQRPVVTFWRRLTRDLREHRKPPLMLLRRGLALMRDQRRVVAHAVELGCEVATPDEARARLGASERHA